MELNRAFDYHKKHIDAEEEALERCGGDRELFCQIAKEMVTEALPDQVYSHPAFPTSGSDAHRFLDDEATASLGGNAPKPQALIPALLPC